MNVVFFLVVFKGGLFSGLLCVYELKFFDLWSSVYCISFCNYCHNIISSVCVLPCPLGYEPNSACTECVPVHICVTDNPCENGGTCNIGTNNNTDYTCSCAPNFSEKNCTSMKN